jgi:riboflavin kinase / FMN adenylyltransferase
VTYARFFIEYGRTMPPNETRRNMHLIRHFPDAAPTPTAVAIGNFDGLHRGHMAVIAAMREAASAKGLVPSVLTFEPHPRSFFKPEAPVFRLASLRDKLAGLREAGVKQVVMPRFDSEFAQMPAHDFLDRVLARQLGAKVVVTGENFAFGHKRGGDVAMLKAWGKKHNIEIITVSPVQIQGDICSSSAIRALVAMGDVKKATKLLGHGYTISGRIVHGDARGREIGFPTANVSLPPNLLLPAHGVYAVRATVGGEKCDGVANLGVRPTVAVDKCTRLEVHLFDMRQEIYGKKMQVCLVDKLRDEMKFSGMDELTAQIKKDCEMARDVLGRVA